MVVMLFGISNVGKTVTGKKLAEKLNYEFFDLDEEIKKRFQTTLEKFMNEYPFPHGRAKVKGKNLRNLIDENKGNRVIAVSPIYYSRNFNSLLDLDQVIAFELQDTEEHIFHRIIFSDDNDNIYKDDAYKEKHKIHYIKDIHEEILAVKRIYNKVKNKYFINNQSVDEVVDHLIDIIQSIVASESNH